MQSTQAENAFDWREVVLNSFLGRFTSRPSRASAYPNPLNALGRRFIFCFWTGENQISEQRKAALLSMITTTGCPVILLNKFVIPAWELKDHPFHKAYEYLSETHKADYLRCYFMHHFGGGYSDIKATNRNWCDAFLRLEQSNALALGYTEIAEGVARIGGDLELLLKKNFKSLIGGGAFIFKPNTELTCRWYGETNALLDRKLALLRKNPASFPQDRTGVNLGGGNPSKYPLRWSELLGEIFHPLVFEFKDKVLHYQIEPIFENYR